MNILAIIRAVDADEQMLLVYKIGTPDSPSSKMKKEYILLLKSDLHKGTFSFKTIGLIQCPKYDASEVKMFRSYGSMSDVLFWDH